MNAVIARDRSVHAVKHRAFDMWHRWISFGFQNVDSRDQMMQKVLPHALHSEDISRTAMSRVIAYTPGWHFSALTESIQFSGKCFSRDGNSRPKPLLTASQLGKKLRATGDSTHGKISKYFFLPPQCLFMSVVAGYETKAKRSRGGVDMFRVRETRVSGALACEWRFDGAKPPGDVFCACAHYSLVRSNRRFPGGDRPLGSGWRERQQVTDSSSTFFGSTQPIRCLVAGEEPIGVGASLATM